MKHQNISSDSSTLSTEFKTLLDKLSSSDVTVLKLGNEIKELRTEIEANLKIHNVSSDVLAEIYSHLKSEKQKLSKCDEYLKSFIEAKEIEEIGQLKALCKEKRAKIERISLFDQYFQKIVLFSQLLQDLKANFDAQQYWKSNENIETAKNLITDIELQLEKLFPNSISNSDLVSDFEFVLCRLRADVNIAYEKFIYDLIQLFKENITFENNGKYKTFRFSFLSHMSEQEYEAFIKCLLKQKDHFKLYMRNISCQLTDHFIKIILIENKPAIFSNNDNDELSNYEPICDRIKFCPISREQSDLSQKCVDKLKYFIENVINLFTINHSLSCSEELVQFIGEFWSNEIFECLTKNYFEILMPRVESQFDEFIDTLEEGRQLQTFFRKIGMIQKDNEVFSDYTKNIKEHFSAKISQDFIIRAKKLLKSDLHELVSSEKALNDFKLESKNKVPLMKVSRFMVDIKELFEEMSLLLTSSSANLKLLLGETFVNVCELFVDVSPFLFKVEIVKDPQQNAVFHNNCLFFGHLIECTVLTHKPRLDCLNEYIPIVRNLATQIFINQMQFQEKILLLSIKNSAFIDSLQAIAEEIPSTDLKISSQSHLNFREGINKCLHHLNTLHIAFVDILPEKICGKAFNTLISSFLTEFLSSVISLNDISSLGASHLSQELDYFSKELKQFLGHSDNLLSKWIKMNELNFILKSSLLEIVNRWADGKGLLANYLTADEVKHLIRALFQNSERRSNALSRIVIA